MPSVAVVDQSTHQIDWLPQVERTVVATCAYCQREFVHTGNPSGKNGLTRVGGGDARADRGVQAAAGADGGAGGGERGVMPVAADCAGGRGGQKGGFARSVVEAVVEETPELIGRGTSRRWRRRCAAAGENSASLSCLVQLQIAIGGVSKSLTGSDGPDLAGIAPGSVRLRSVEPHDERGTDTRVGAGRPVPSMALSPA